jgi:hypothetical protein
VSIHGSVMVWYFLTHSPVPIYNGVGGKLNFARLHHLASDLEVWEGDLVGTICLVGYTANSWIPKDVSSKQLSLNIQWVIVLANE